MTNVQGSCSDRPEADAAENHHSDHLIGRLLSVIAGVGTMAGLTLGLLRLQHSGRFDAALALNGGFALTSLAALWLVRLGRHRPAANLLLWGGWLLNVAFLGTRGGVHNINWMTFLVLISGAAWMLGERLTLAMTLASTTLYVVAAQAEPLGWFGPTPPYNARIAEVYTLVIFGLCAAMSLLARRSYRHRIERERQVSTALSAREGELRKLSQVIEQSPECVLITDLDGHIEYANPAAKQQLRLATQSRLTDPDGTGAALNAWELTAQDAGEATVQTIRAALTAGRSWQGELRSQRDERLPRVEAMRVSPMQHSDGRVTHHVWLRQDITALHEAKARLRHLALHDSLTGLPNRAQVEERLAGLMAQARRSQRLVGLVQLNIDRFKTVNEARGQAAGDRLLQAVGERLGSLTGNGEVVARLGTDEFIVLLPDLEGDPASAGHVAYAFACRAQEALLRPLPLSGGDQVAVTASIGIALAPSDAQDSVAGAQQRATTALSRAKAQGGGNVAFFEASMGDAAQRRFDIERGLHEALVGDQLRLFLQPQVDAQGRWCGAEALLRWQHPRLGSVSPGLFIPIAEESDLIVGLGRWVFVEAIRLIAQAASAGRALALSVNLSPRQFRQPDFVAWMQQLLADSGIDPRLLTLEITEGLVIGDVEETIARMRALRELGLHFSIDDFGTGYSSLAYLKRLPISELKIDKAFIQEAPQRADDAALVETILSVAGHMRLKVVAEGVETEAQARFLAERAPGVILQGYLYGKPGPAEDWLARWQADAALPALAALAALPVDTAAAAASPAGEALTACA